MLPRNELHTLLRDNPAQFPPVLALQHGRFLSTGRDSTHSRRQADLSFLIFEAEDRVRARPLIVAGSQRIPAPVHDRTSRDRADSAARPCRRQPQRRLCIHRGRLSACDDMAPRVPCCLLNAAVSTKRRVRRCGRSAGRAPWAGSVIDLRFLTWWSEKDGARFRSVLSAVVRSVRPWSRVGEAVVVDHVLGSRRASCGIHQLRSGEVLPELVVYDAVLVREQVPDLQDLLDLP